MLRKGMSHSPPPYNLHLPSETFTECDIAAPDPS
jgi:hypothetical protein